jgi:beta-lactam-binding protein with PASTA domain
VLAEHLNADVPAPSVEAPEAAPLDGVVARSTRRDPGQRYPTASAMRTELAAAARDLPEAPPLRELSAELTSVVANDTQQTIVAPARRRRRRWPWFVAAFLVVIVAAAAVLVRPLPKVSGLTEAAALARLQEAGLHGTVQTQFSSATAGTVIGARSSVISLGSFGLRGGKVALTVSKGPDVVPVPTLVNGTLAAAQAAVQAGRLALAPVNYQYSSSAVSGTVIAQYPPAATQVSPGTPVSLTVSKGVQTVTVPNVTGTAYSAAAATLSGVTLTAVPQYAYDAAVSGTVIGQSPAAGAPVPVGTRVTLTISQGAPPFAMPDLTNQGCAAAETTLQGLGLTVTAVNTSGGTGCTTNKVLGQDPVPGVNVQKGQAATLYVP